MITMMTMTRMIIVIMFVNVFEVSNQELDHNLKKILIVLIVLQYDG